MTEKKFEDNLTELESIVKKLENGDVALEEAISEFQKGMKLSDKLKETLNQAEETLVKIVGKDGKDGKDGKEKEFTEE
ncbi:MAG: exodeoxyribonuclease VII small subunit [Streptococcaceae bacterium]|nr:exodeoxyribonuclease VII small subunit [Streptococcaceae bacterium]